MLTLEVQTHIDASPDKVWSLIGDPTRMGDWSPECRSVTWARGSTTPDRGARFKGHNRNGWRRWTTTGNVVSYEPGRDIAWDVSIGLLAVARWGYRIEPDSDGRGCTVTESFTDKRGGLVKGLGRVARGVSDVETHNRRGMEQTLANVKAAAESANTSA
jgi:uncharacterized protein YndB with AHSA1/START domain